MMQCSRSVLLYSASLSCRAACIEPLCIGRLYNAPAYTACQCDNSRRSRPLLSALPSCSSTAWVFLTGTAAPRRSCAPPHTAHPLPPAGGPTHPLSQSWTCGATEHAKTPPGARHQHSHRPAIGCCCAGPCTGWLARFLFRSFVCIMSGRPCVLRGRAW